MRERWQFPWAVIQTVPRNEAIPCCLACLVSSDVVHAHVQALLRRLKVQMRPRRIAVGALWVQAVTNFEAFSANNRRMRPVGRFAAQPSTP
eukprot:6620028-Prymnesium_polylepis.1